MYKLIQNVFKKNAQYILIVIIALVLIFFTLFKKNKKENFTIAGFGDSLTFDIKEEESGESTEYYLIVELNNSISTYYASNFKLNGKPIDDKNYKVSIATDNTNPKYVNFEQGTSNYRMEFKEIADIKTEILNDIKKNFNDDTDTNSSVYFKKKDTSNEAGITIAENTNIPLEKILFLFNKDNNLN
tara:strand:- start:6033 stop:6590 length:558 start_codon:yes stop_codon:yes gene_type:complete